MDRHMYTADVLIILLVAAGLGLIPAELAKRKGRSFALWWLYGWLLFIVAIIHVSLIKPVGTEPVKEVVQIEEKSVSSVDELIAYKELLDAGALTQEEFDIKKKQILKL